MRVKLPAAPAALVPNSMSHVDRGNGGVVEWAPETLCRRSAFDDKPTDREKEVVTVRAWRRSRFVSVLTVCSEGQIAREDKDMQPLFLFFASLLPNRSKDTPTKTTRGPPSLSSPQSWRGSSAPRAVSRGPGLPRQPPGSRDTLDGDVSFDVFGGTVFETVPQQAVPNESWPSGTCSAGAHPTTRAGTAASSNGRRRLCVEVRHSTTSRHPARREWPPSGSD